MNPVGLPVALGLGAVGVLAVHPSVLVAAVVFGIALLVHETAQGRIAAGDMRTLGAATVVGVVLGLPLLRGTIAATGGVAIDWPADVPASDAIGAMLTFSHGQGFPQYWLAALVILALLQRRTVGPMLWFVVAGGLFAGLYVLAASYENALVAALTRPWWNDRWRFAAIWGMAAVVPAGAGLVIVYDAVLTAVGRLVPTRRPSLRASRPFALATGLVVATLIVVMTDGLYHTRNETRLATAYPVGRTVDAAEQRTYEELSRLVPAGSMVMNDPYDGSAAMWTLAGVRPVFASPVIQPQELNEMEPDRKLLYDAFNRIGSDPAVRAAADRLGVRFAVIGEGFISGDRHVPGMTGLEHAPGLELIRRDGDARIYRITP